MNDAAPAYHRERARSGPLSLSTQIYQGLGAIPDTCVLVAFGTLLLFYYNQVLGVPATRASLALTLALVIDAIADPLMGSLSDGFRSRLGRRHPFMYASVLPLAVTLTLTFSPPAGLSHDQLFVWLLGFSVASRLSMTLFSVPWTALYPELTDDYAERSAVVMWRYLVAWVGWLVFAQVAWRFVFPSTPEYTPGHLNPHGYALFAPLLGGIVAVSALLSTHLTRREIPYLLQPADGSAPPSWRSSLRELALAARNRDFTLLVVAILVTAAIAGTLSALELYAQTYFWGLVPENLSWFGFAVSGAVLAFVAIRPLQAHFEKRTLLIGSALLSLVNGFIVVALRFADVLPENGDPRLLEILVANAFVRVVCDTITGIMFGSMVADTLDAQELAFGRRQEGVFSAVLSFAAKVTTGVGVMLGGLLLDLVIRMPQLAGGVSLDPATLRRLGVVAGFGLPILYLIPLAIAAFYRIDRARHAEIVAALGKRRV